MHILINSVKGHYYFSYNLLGAKNFIHFIESLQQSWEIGIFRLLLQVRKLKHKLNDFPKVTDWV